RVIRMGMREVTSACSIAIPFLIFKQQKMNIYLILAHVYISHEKVEPPLHKLEVQKNQPGGWFL
ncbi:hypothetical protein P7M56_19460, partial [Vibrio parahaemolyticus]|nr:hypothetical protein [Vibrio parahaemolyticus]